MGAKVAFETGTCHRCNGSGRYSWCQMWGDTCFSCKGSGVTLTRRGAKAAAAFRAHRLAVSGRPVESVTAGARVMVDGKFRTIESVRTDGGSKFLNNTTGEWTSFVELFYTVKRVSGPEPTSHGFIPGSTVVVAESPEEWAALVAFADTVVGTLIDGVPSAATVAADNKTAKRRARVATKEVA